MDLGIRGRTAVVCASTRGLGAATARALAAEGARTVVSGRSADGASRAAAELPGAIGVAADLATPDGPTSLLDAAEEAFGPVDILVLNSGGPPPGRASDLDVGAVESAVATLMLAHQRLVARVLPGMRERGWGRILAIGSSGVVSPLPDLALSNIARAALAGYLKTLAGEVAGDGVTVNLLLPGRIATARLAAVDTARAESLGAPVDEVEAESRASIPAGRYGTPDEFGAVAAFLCSAAASYVTGTATRCDGGLVATL